MRNILSCEQPPTLTREWGIPYFSDLRPPRPLAWFTFFLFFSSFFRSPLIAPFLSQVLRDPTRLKTRVGVPLFRDPCPPCPAHERKARRRNQLVRFF
jgi:hypothetical protein